MTRLPATAFTNQCEMFRTMLNCIQFSPAGDITAPSHPERLIIRAQARALCEGIDLIAEHPEYEPAEGLDSLNAVAWYEMAHTTVALLSSEPDAIGAFFAAKTALPPMRHPSDHPDGD